MDWFSPTVFVGLLLLATLGMVFGALVLLEPENDPPPEPPKTSFIMNETHDTLRVNTTDGELAWGQLQVALDRPGRFLVQGDGNHTKAEPMVFEPIANESTLKKGDRLSFCLENGGGGLEVTLRHKETGQVLDTFRFPEVDSCEPKQPEEPKGNETAEEGTRDDGADDHMSGGPSTDRMNVTSHPVSRQGR